MKKLFFLAVVAAFSTTSCTKDRTCTCTSGNSTDKTTLVGVTKGQAKANCVSTKYTDPTSGTSYTRDCKLD